MTSIVAKFPVVDVKMIYSYNFFQHATVLNQRVTETKTGS